jgi:hypothetical protein
VVIVGDLKRAHNARWATLAIDNLGAWQLWLCNVVDFGWQVISRPL